MQTEKEGLILDIHKLIQDKMTISLDDLGVILREDKLGKWRFLGWEEMIYYVFIKDIYMDYYYEGKGRIDVSLYKRHGLLWKERMHINPL